MRDILDFLVEHSLLDPVLTGLWLGFSAIGFDGNLYRTPWGEEFLVGRA